MRWPVKPLKISSGLDLPIEYEQFLKESLHVLLTCRANTFYSGLELWGKNTHTCACIHKDTEAQLYSHTYAYAHKHAKMCLSEKEEFHSFYHKTGMAF